MSKSFWLMSAGICALAATPAFAQDNTTPTGTASPTQAGEVATTNATTDTSSPAADEAVGNDIVVTAQGRTQVLQDVPIAVSAVSAESLQNSGANDIRQLNQLAPSLLVSSTGSEANGSARIRGIGTVGDNPGLESSVAVFIDGVYRSRTGVGLNELGEIERVEVLRGPQGTLFGRNASAGLLNIISKKPNLNQMEGFVEATYGNYDAMRLSGGITGPISPSVGFRLDGVWSQRDGFLKNITAGGGSERRINDRNRYFVRGQLLFEPNDQISVRIIGDYSHRDESCCGAVYLSTLETTDPTPGVPGDFAVASSNRIVSVLQSLGGVIPPNPFDRQVAITPGRTYKGVTRDGGISGQLDWKFGEAAQLTSITAYRDYKSDGPSDTDYSNVDILYRDPAGGGYQRGFKTFSQELRLQGQAFDDRFDWLIGGYYAHEKLRASDNLKFGNQYGAFASCRLVATVSPLAVLRNPAAPGCLSAAATAPGSPFSSTGALGSAGPLIASGLVRLSTVNNVGDNGSLYFQTSENWAIFTHNIFKITDRLSATIGLRYTNESKDFSARFNNNNAVCPVQQAAFANFLAGGSTALPAALQPLVAGVVNLTCQGNATTALNALNLADQRDESEWTGTGILSWKPIDDVLVYASYSKGYKAGGFNLDRSALGNPIFAPNDPRQAATGGFGTQNLQFDPEKVTSYELGFKYGNRHITLNGAFFYQQFRNFQLNTFNGSVFLVQNVNGCSSLVGGSTTDQDPVGGLANTGSGGCDPKNVTPGVISQGVELEAAVYPARSLQITAGITYADTHYKNDLVGRNTGQPLDPALFLLPGDQLSNAPTLVSTASITWTPRIGDSGLSGLVYADARMSNNYNTGSDLFPEKEQEAFTVVNARVGIRGPQQKWSVELWAQNLFNEEYQQVAFNTPFQGSNSRAHVTNFGAPSFATANQLFSSYLSEPRTYGITGRFRF
jgi:outer membrane receptor protein involved in Fe transport